MYIGAVPWLKELCSVPLYMDEVRFYNKIVYESEIEAEAAPALGGIATNFIQLACINCSLPEAAESCHEGYHLCTAVELHTGGF